MKKKRKARYIYMTVLALGVLVFIGGALRSFYNSVQYRIYERQLESMKNLSMQGSAVVEKNLEGLFNTLYGLMEALDKDDLTGDANIEKMEQFLEKRDVEFQRLAIADARGYAKVTNSESIDIGNRSFFHQCMEHGEEAIEIRDSELVGKRVCLVAVPVMTEEESPAGVLYGIIEMGVFNIYSNTLMENEHQYIQIIDKNGGYIVKEETSMLGKRENIFDGLSYADSSESISGIKDHLNKEQQIFTTISNGSSEEIVYFTPLKFNSWCVVTVMNLDEVVDSMKYILGNNVYMMLLQIICVIVIICVLILYYFWRDKKKIEEYNEQLMFDEEIFKIAAEKSGVSVLIYSVNSRQLRFINNSLREIPLPPIIENAPTELFKYIPVDRDLQLQIREIFENMERENGKREVSLCFQRDGQEMYIRIQLTGLAGANGRIRQCVGTIEDVTEQQNLRKKAEKDPLTGLYNRTKASDLIEACLKEPRPKKGRTHACLIFDLDNFKVLNDTLGHQTGDTALQDVAGILQQHFREYDIVSRLGGDEFLVFLKDIPEKAIHRNVSSLLKKLDLTYQEGNQSVRMTASVGIVLVPDKKCDFRELYRKADRALYEVKHESKNNFKIYG